jgi:uncharacterized protein with HEPN domain
MQKDELYLHDIVDAADAIQRFLQGISRETFLEDELRQSAVLQKLIVIGEAAGHLSDLFRSNHPEIAWQDITGFRNIAVHQYFAVNREIVWVTATGDVPQLLELIAKILDEEYGER